MKKVKVFVGMSGGVDSSVSAALLKKAGYDVTGVFIKVWNPEWLPCTWKEDRRDAMRVAALLGIPFLTLDLAKEYKKEVVDYMIREYKAGRTPNPDIMCNKEIKFGAFLDFALKKGAGYVATGHYARVEDGKLLEGRDKNKDQSYFLWTLTKKQLERILFPVGNLEKNEVRKLARKFKLPNFDKKDSQGLCFIGKIEMKDFLKNYLKTRPGKVLNEKDEVIGHHSGAIFYTIGERHGFSIDKKSPNDSPYYVIAKDIKKNVIVVSNKQASHERDLKSCRLTATNWLGESRESRERSILGRVRYRAEKIQLTLDRSKKIWKVTFQKPQSGIAPGQSLVIYDKEQCVGGGIFEV